MTDMRTEEEQIEAIKKWWQENGKQTIVALVVVLGGWFGYQGYQGQQKQMGEAASVVYQEVLTLQNSETEEEKGRRAVLLDQLQKEYGSTVYAQYAGLFKAKDAVDAGDLAAAATELEAVKNNTSDDALRHLATTRLARVLVAQEKLDEALSILATDSSSAFSAEYFETKGDALLAKGDEAGARDAYSQAVVEAQRIGANNPVLKMKLDDLAVAN
ncbi:YfgM family protein [Bermanella sp. WJH001]|uniref:YfgM family protein n=1 Tax=Bermanella sp. WJH001 TaxID=3048005 RepID=UPI0024BDCD1E|nr:tetratricopeptide repeat protein [Bermanella sp. WJH001]MDJ1538176.1 tetratricopeptide repeat protein [Bermanella sp. WJH001]